MEKPSFREAFKFWLKLGFISFGGPAGQIAIMHQFLVEKKKWISESKFLHALNYCMMLPGPEAQQLATYSGWLLHGTRGGIAAGALFILPSVFILLGLSIVYVEYGKIEWVSALFNGLKPAVVAIVVVALIKISKKSLLLNMHWLIAVMAFILIFFFKISFPVIILGTILFGISAIKLFPRMTKPAEKEKKISEESEKEYCINKFSPPPSSELTLARITGKLTAAILFWLLPVGAVYLLFPDFQFWKSLILFFTKAAFVTFGGAYAVLPYVAQVSVEKFHWLSQLEMIDGLALGETTPGPLIMVLAFVGFMAGHHHFSSVAFAAGGLAVTAYYTFLPSFFFILIGAPLIEKTQHSIRVKSVLGCVTAAVTGVVLNLAVYFAEAVIFPSGISFEAVNYFAGIWLIVSFVAMKYFKMEMILWIGISAAAGLAEYFLLKII